MTVNWQQVREYQDIIYERADGIAKITINRPEVRNAFRPQTVAEMIDAFADAREDQAVGVVLLTGAGDEAFCSGGDQKVRGDAGYVGDDRVPRLNVLDLQRQIRYLPKPVIAVVAGYAIGGGHVLHLVCDLTIAADNAVFGQTGPASAASTPATARRCWRAPSATRRRGRSGTSAGSTRRRRRWRWASSTPSSRSSAWRKRRCLGERDPRPQPDRPALPEGRLQRRHRRPRRSAAARRRRHAALLHDGGGPGGTQCLRGEARPRLLAIPTPAVGGRRWLRPASPGAFDAVTDGCLPDWLGRRAVTHPAPGAHRGVRQLDFAELDDRVSDAARQLAALGVADGDRVALLARNGPAFVVMVHAVGRLGAVLVPLNVRLTPVELAWQLTDARATLLLPRRRTSAALPRRPPIRSVGLRMIEIGPDGPEGSAAAAIQPRDTDRPR